MELLEQGLPRRRIHCRITRHHGARRASGAPLAALPDRPPRARAGASVRDGLPDGRHRAPAQRRGASVLDLGALERIRDELAQRLHEHA